MTAPDAAGAPPGREADAAPAALEARGLVRDFGAVRAVDGVTFRLRPGEVLVLFGPNGAGKTTLLRMLGGGLKPTAGQVRIGGHRMTPGDPEGHALIGVLSHRTFLYSHLTVAENLRFYGRLYDLQDLGERVFERLTRVGLAERRSSPVAELSRGMRQRLALARTLLHDPRIVLLDEPWTGLDPHAASLLREVLGSLRDGERSVVLVTHNLSQGLELADRVAIMVRGRLAYLEPRKAVEGADFEALYHETVEGALP